MSLRTVCSPVNWRRRCASGSLTRLAVSACPSFYIGCFERLLFRRQVTLTPFRMRWIKSATRNQSEERLSEIAWCILALILPTGNAGRNLATSLGIRPMWLMETRLMDDDRHWDHHHGIFGLIEVGLACPTVQIALFDAAPTLSALIHLNPSSRTQNPNNRVGCART